jgi:hypothetical protein
MTIGINKENGHIVTSPARQPSTSTIAFEDIMIPKPIEMPATKTNI